MPTHLFDLFLQAHCDSILQIGLIVDYILNNCFLFAAGVRQMEVHFEILQHRVLLNWVYLSVVLQLDLVYELLLHQVDYQRVHYDVLFADRTPPSRGSYALLIDLDKVHKVETLEVRTLGTARRQVHHLLVQIAFYFELKLLMVHHDVIVSFRG